MLMDRTSFLILFEGSAGQRNSHQVNGLSASGRRNKASLSSKTRKEESPLSPSKIVPLGPFEAQALFKTPHCSHPKA